MFRPSRQSAPGDVGYFEPEYEAMIQRTVYAPFATYGCQGSYGAAEATPTTTATEDDWTSYVPFVREVLWGDDPRTEQAVLEAKLKSYKEMERTAVWPFTIYYRNEIAKMEAKLAAVKQIAAETQQSADLSKATRIVGIGAGTVAIVVLLAGGAYLAIRANRESKEAQRAMAEMELAHRMGR